MFNVTCFSSTYVNEEVRTIRNLFVFLFRRVAVWVTDDPCSSGYNVFEPMRVPIKPVTHYGVFYLLPVDLSKEEKQT